MCVCSNLYVVVVVVVVVVFVVKIRRYVNLSLDAWYQNGSGRQLTLQSRASISFNYFSD